MKTDQIAAQLYTCRDLLKTPAEIAKTLSRLRAVGYTAVQASGLGPIDEDELIKILDGEGMVCCATHEPGAKILKEPAAVADRLEKLRCKLTAYPFPSGITMADPDSVSGLIRGLDEAGAVLAERGMTLCYHNHNHEFFRADDRTVLERIYAETKPENLQAELDTYWVQFGGGDNVALIEKLHGRLPIVHLKDFMTTADAKPTFCEVGSGNLDFKKIVAVAGQAGCRWFAVEQDTCPGDPVESLATSFRYLVENVCS